MSRSSLPRLRSRKPIRCDFSCLIFSLDRSSARVASAFAKSKRLRALDSTPRTLAFPCPRSDHWSSWALRMPFTLLLTMWDKPSSSSSRNALAVQRHRRMPLGVVALLVSFPEECRWFPTSPSLLEVNMVIRTITVVLTASPCGRLRIPTAFPSSMARLPSSRLKRPSTLLNLLRLASLLLDPRNHSLTLPIKHRTTTQARPNSHRKAWYLGNR